MTAFRIAVPSYPITAGTVFAVAALRLALAKLLSPNETVEAILTNDPVAATQGNARIRVGGIFNPLTYDFDPKLGEGGTRPNGIQYDVFGLVWKELGTLITGRQEVAKKIEETFVQLVDAAETGFVFHTGECHVAGLTALTISDLFRIRNATWLETKALNQDSLFVLALDEAQVILSRFIKHGLDELKAKEVVVVAVRNAFNPNVIILRDPCSWREVVLAEAPQALFVITAHDGMNTVIEPIPGGSEGEVNRCNFPQQWWGLSYDDFQIMTDEPGASTCATDGSSCTTKDLKTALSLVAKAIQHSPAKVS